MNPGDLLFCRGTGIVSRAIRFGEHGARWNHVAWLDRYENGCWYVGQAEAHGVTTDKTLDSLGYYHIVHPPPEVDREKLLRFLRAQVGDRYGWVTIASIVATLIAPDWLNVMTPGTWICSAVVAEGLRFGGWYHDWTDIYQTEPQELYDAINVRAA